MSALRAVLAVAALLLGARSAESQTGSIEGRLADALLARLPAAIYLEAAPGKTFPPPTERPVIDQRNLIFLPHVLPVQVGTTVDFRNSDTVKHNIFSTRRSPTVFNLGTYTAGVVRSVTFDKPGVVTLLCNVHTEMSAYVVVSETPYFTVTDREGSFRISGVPEGSYQIHFWHEILVAPPQAVTVEGGKTARIEWREPKRK